jgi:LmbE family N-acetylglucosaminyl deacetylase
MGCIDGELVPSLDVRNKLIGVIRAIQPDVILTHRMNDYHPDHRYTSQLVQDASFLLQVPNVVEKVPALKYSPVILYWRDKFEKPYPFEPDIVINIDDTFGIKLQMLGQHESQIFEWLPWISGFYQKIPQDLDPQTRQQWVKKIYEMLVPSSIPMEYQKLLISRYGEREGKGTKEIEAFALSEYGYRVGRSQLQVLFAGC